MNIIHSVKISTATLRMIARSRIGFSLAVSDERQPDLIGVVFLADNPEHAERKYIRIVDRECAKLAAEQDFLA